METVSVDEAELPAERLTEVGLTDGTGPDGETEGVKFTVPEKPFRLFKLMEVVPEAPWSIVREVGLELMLKSGLEVPRTTKLPVM